MKKVIVIINLIGITLIANSTLNAQVSTIEFVDPCITCEQLMDLKLPDVTITSAERVDEGNPHCRILGVIGREIKFEILLPNKWNARFVMGGGGGFVGTIQNQARSSVNQGYATSGTDTGHEGSSWWLADWALNNMERQLNFGHLAIHRTAGVSKAIIGNYYGNYPVYSYFIGCSRGGGQAMMEAQRYPEDFDGIVVRAPAIDWPALAAEDIQNTQAVYPLSLTDPIITPDKIRMLQDAVLNQCDMIDGVRDNIINNPYNCKFNFDLLPKCPGDIPGTGCFTTQQIKAIRTIYDGVDLGNGITYPGFPFGGENAWQSWITGPNNSIQKLGYPTAQAALGIEMFKYLILQNPDWDYLTYDFTGYEKEIRYASAYLNATSTDYSGFKNRNGKIIFFHGWNDAALSAYNTIDHYNAVKANDPGIESYMKLYLLPGVQHCGGGVGPSQVDRIALIRDWVENGNPPDRIIVSKTKNDEVIMTRPVYPYPRIAVYDGSGDPNVESSFIEKISK